MKIALAHFRTGQTDGVSLEMDKWRSVLEEMGHQVFYISGSPEAEIQIKELFYQNKKNLKFVENAYYKLEDYNNEAELKAEIEAEADIIARKLTKEIKEAKIKLLIPNNIFSLGWNLQAAVAFKNVIEKLGLKTIAHHHDFYWERKLYSNPVCSFVAKMLEENFPPRLEEIEHIVINKIAQKELEKRKELNSKVVPNVFDFQAPFWEQDEYNADLRAKLGIKKDDIVLLHATRITERKAIELAVKFAAKLQAETSAGSLYDGRNFSEENKVVFLLPGLTESNQSYQEFLDNYAQELNLEIIWAEQFFAHKRQLQDGKKIYSFWDSYVISDLITYTSIKEGWGNQLLEALFAKKPLVIFEYPVFKSDLKKYNLKLASLGENYEFRQNGYLKIKEEKYKPAVEKALRYLKDKQYRSQTVEHNFKIAAENFSYSRLEELLTELI